MNYTNNPVIIPVPYTDHNTRSGSTITKAVSFHQLILTVTASCNGKSVTHEFSSPCPNTGSNSINFDIHTCLQAAAENYPWSPTTIGDAPTVTFSAAYHAEYLLDGVLTRYPASGNTSYTASAVTATIGGLTDFERKAAGATLPEKTTSKPTATSPQTALSDETVIIGGVEQTGAAVYNDDGSIKTASTANSAVARMSDRVSDTPDYYIFRFVNRYGCIESIGVRSLVETQVNITANEFAISRPDYLASDLRRTRYTKQNDYETWKLSSGPLDRPWQQWFAHELLMAEHCWLYVGDSWQRVHIVPEETTALLNRTDASLLTVNFTVRFDLNGSPV